MLWYVLRQIGIWLMTVPGLSVVPILIHHGANYFNKLAPPKAHAADIADGFLYLFILTITAIIDAVGASRQGTTVYFLGFALFTAVLYFASLVDQMAIQAVEPLGFFVLLFAWGIGLPYVCIKFFDLYGEGKAKWLEAQRKRGTAG